MNLSSKTYSLVLTAFGAAIIAVLAQITIPLPLVPITGQTLAIGLIVTILGFKYGTIAVLVYILLGAVGFAGVYWNVWWIINFSWSNGRIYRRLYFNSSSNGSVFK